MANQTVSVNRNFDDAAISGLANGENITIDTSAVLTINSDVRWGQQAAVLGEVTVTQGEYYIDATNTWWIPFDASTGNVPSLGTCGTPDVTRGGSNVGEFLGVWTALGVAPSAAGGAMPASGFVKLRTKSTTLADDDVLTFAGGATITINSTTGGQRGWIHYVGKEGTSSTTGRVLIPRLGKLTVRGDWFLLGTGSGASGQTMQYFVADYCPGIWVETSSGSGVYEEWGFCPSADFSSTNIATDNRGRFFTCDAAGLITFGGATHGKLIPSGARVYCANIHHSSSTSANWAANTLTATSSNRNAFVSTGGSVDVRYMGSCGAFTASNSPLFSFRYTACIDGGFNDNNATAQSNSGNIENYFEHCISSRHGVNALMFAASYSNSVTFKNCAAFRSSGATASSFNFGVSNCTNVLLENILSISNGTVIANDISYSSGITLTSPIIVGASGQSILTVTGCSNFKATNVSVDGKSCTAATAATNAIVFTNCSDVLVDGMAYWASTVPPSLYWVSAASQTSNIRIRNIGSRATPLDLGAVGRRLVSLANVNGAYISKVYQKGGSQSPDTTVLTSNSDNVVVSDCGNPTDYTDQSAFTTANSLILKRLSSGGSKAYTTSPTTGLTATVFTAYGLHFAEQEVSSTEVWLTVHCGTEKSTSRFSTPAYTDDVGTVLRDGQNGLMLTTLNDQITWTWTHWIRGLTAFANTAPVLSGTNTGNFTLTYDLDKGTGFSGSFKTLSAANLSGETGILATGVKLRIRAVCATANTANVLKAISVVGTTSGTDITNNPYPYNEPLVSVTGGQSSTIAAVFRDSDGKLLDVRQDGSSISLYPAWFADAACTLRVRKPGWSPIESGFTLTEAGLAYPVSQTDVSTIADTDPGALSITVTNHGASPVTWNSKQFSITVTVTDSSTPADIARYLSWHTAQDSFSLGGGFHNTAWPSMVVAAGTSFETARGVLFGSAGAASKGVRVVDGSGNAIIGFTRMQADDGTYYTPTVASSITLSGLVAGSEVRAYVGTDPATATVLASTESSGTSFTINHTYTSTAGFIVVRNTGYKFIKLNVTYATGDSTIPVSQQSDPWYSNP